MPNHVTTRCIMNGPTEDIAHFCALLIRVPDEATEVTLDFDRIIPMPGILKGTGAAGADLGIEILTGKPKPDSVIGSFLNLPWVQQLGITTDEALRAWAEKERPEAIEEGRKQIEACSETGFYDWYDWSIENWGTKWNSYWFGIDHKAEGELSFHFDTAWSFPTPIFEKLAEMFPAICFECTCFDEGWNFAGTGAFNGEPPFKIVEVTDELHEFVYGHKPEFECELESAPVFS